MTEPTLQERLRRYPGHHGTIEEAADRIDALEAKVSTYADRIGLEREAREKAEAERDALREASGALALAVEKFTDAHTIDLDEYFRCDVCRVAGRTLTSIAHREWCVAGQIGTALGAFNRAVTALAKGKADD